MGPVVSLLLVSASPLSFLQANESSIFLLRRREEMRLEPIHFTAFFPGRVEDTMKWEVELLNKWNLITFYSFHSSPLCLLSCMSQSWTVQSTFEYWSLNLFSQLTLDGGIFICKYTVMCVVSMHNRVQGLNMFIFGGNPIESLLVWVFITSDVFKGIKCLKSMK